jgi:hypothetical protein
MAKTIRSIKADLCDDEILGSCSRDARFLFVALITRVDDHGRFRANPSLLRSRIYPYDDDVTGAMVSAWLAELADKDRVRLYEADGQQYLVIPRWPKHQRIDNAARSEIPPPPEPESPQAAADCGDSPLQRESLARFAVGREGRGGEGRGRPSPLAAAGGFSTEQIRPHPAPFVAAAEVVDIDAARSGLASVREATGL